MDMRRADQRFHGRRCQPQHVVPKTHKRLAVIQSDNTPRLRFSATLRWSRRSRWSYPLDTILVTLGDDQSLLLDAGFGEDLFLKRLS